MLSYYIIYFNADFNCVSWSRNVAISLWIEDGKANRELIMTMLYKYIDANKDKLLGLSRKNLKYGIVKKFKSNRRVKNLDTNDMS